MFVFALVNRVLPYLVALSLNGLCSRPVVSYAEFFAGEVFAGPFLRTDF